ncbi:YgiQ family radical SAM protein [Blautia glucerasea]|uniref:YgiQ family radical SAM protein n=1 Tax=Blautia glucerasea TaxID=536633 RepID=UPI001D01E22A|nr:YgiQ family radical SAM protein [Blautia glucerasea]MCB5388668.1 YgiQ family radical SAM protein [Blautia glucerasea]MCB5423003.1 YgiQ family radical SAM protein [Blautia luti]
MSQFLPVTKKDMEARGWEQLDFVYVTGDAYVDHSSFGTAIISRLLESRGYKVGIIPQPDWRRKESIAVLGEPRLGFLVSAGNMDSMVNHYTVAKKHRQKDSYSPGGKMGLRPDRAVIVYSNLIRQTFKKTPIILGGIEASLRRMAHYDYWENKVKHSILIDSGADLISYGMGEHSIIEIAEALDSGIPVAEITYVAGTVYKCKDLSRAYAPIVLPSYEAVKEDKMSYAKSFAIQYQNTDPFTAGTMAESYGNKGYVIQNPPALPLTQNEMDDVYDLPYVGSYHPMYEKDGGIPALEEIRFSLTSNRGCFGSCSFCALTFHQGRILQTRSHESILKEAVHMTEEKDFKGYIHDVGGPTADFRQPSCQKQLTRGVCKNRHCLFPEPCKNLTADHKDYVSLLRKLRNLPKVKKVFVRSGVRFDYVLADPDKTFLNELAKYHVSGQLRVAPEHVSNQVLKYMGKPSHEVYQKFLEEFDKANQKAGLQQFAVPYFMSSHPGCTMKEAVKLAEYVRELGFTPEQVQDFYPTPSTLSTCMYYTGIHPLTGEKVYVPKNAHEKSIQRALMQYKNPANRELVLEGLKIAGRMDLVGYGEKCLIRPIREGHGGDRYPENSGRSKTSRHSTGNRVPAPRKTIRNNHTRKKQK